MVVLGAEVLTIGSGDDVVRARQLARRSAVDCGFGLVDLTRIVTATSELARNTLVHGAGGTMTVELVFDGGRRGLRITFSDAGPGIADIEAAMRPGFTTGNGLGLGLGGARRLVDEFTLESVLGRGTQVVVVKWTR
jgi:serine/threonine-protein kinase RsbT